MVTPCIVRVLGGFPGPSGATVNRKGLLETAGRKMGVHFSGGGKVGVGVRGNGGINSEKVEHDHAVNSYAINSGPV